MRKSHSVLPSQLVDLLTARIVLRLSRTSNMFRSDINSLPGNATSFTCPPVIYSIANNSRLNISETTQEACASVPGIDSRLVRGRRRLSRQDFLDFRKDLVKLLLEEEIVSLKLLELRLDVALLLLERSKSPGLVLAWIHLKKCTLVIHMHE